MYLGIDTSCYTTSVALLSKEGVLLADERKLLKVPEGKFGLRQSEMVFQHSQNLPLLFEKIGRKKIFENEKIKRVVASNAPRSIKDSYMPTFTVGANFAKSLSLINNIFLHILSHQENHLWATFWSLQKEQLCNIEKIKEFLFLHISGGTTEIVQVKCGENLQKLNTKVVMETKDLSAGQFVDRVGNAMGMGFPSGVFLEKLALQNKEKIIDLPSAYMKEGFFSFSGVTSHVQRMINKGTKPSLLAAAIELCIAKSLLLGLQEIISETLIKDVIVIGGVSANLFLRRYLHKHLPKEVRLYFPKEEYSTDNAVGNAYLASLLDK